MAQDITLSGKVVKKAVGKDSKSDRVTVMLVVLDKEYVLRQHGGSAFGDPELDELVGKNIKADGKLHGYTFIMSDWEEV